MKISYFRFLLVLGVCSAGCSLSHNPDLPSVKNGDGDGIFGDGDGNGDGDFNGDGDGDGDSDGGTGGAGETRAMGGAAPMNLSGGQTAVMMGGFAGASLEEN